MNKKIRLFFLACFIAMLTVCMSCRADYGEDETSPDGSFDKPFESAVMTDAHEKEQPDFSGYYFAYDSLRGEERECYRIMYGAIAGFLHDTPLNILDQGRIQHVFEAVKNDHPELFWVGGYTLTQYSRGGNVFEIRFEPDYTMEKEESQARQRQIDLYTEQCLAGVPAGADDYEKIRYVYEYIILNTDYNLEAEDNQNICSTFIGRQTVCQGYASGMQYLLQKLEIPCTVVTGQIAARGNHAWNMVIADGEYYYVDATWGDPSYGEGSMENQGINYQYLMVNSADLAKTHVADLDFLWPVTESRKDNYYIREGLYMEQWEDGWIEDLIRSALENGEHLFSFRTSPDAAEETKDNLITDSGIYRLIRSAQELSSTKERPVSGVSYSMDEQMNVFTFFLDY